MTEYKRFKFDDFDSKIEMLDLIDTQSEVISDLEKENEELKRFKRLVFDSIDKSLKEDKRFYKMCYEDYLNGRIEALEELKKVIEDD